MTHLGPIKALTVRQPHATLLAVGALRVHPLPWCHTYRGPLAIHAGTYRPRGTAYDQTVRKALLAAGVSPDPEALPRGAVIGICQEVRFYGMRRDVQELGRALFAIDEDELLLGVDAFHLSLGDYGPGRFALVTERPRLLRTPIPATTGRGFWDWQPPGPLGQVR